MKRKIIKLPKTNSTLYKQLKRAFQKQFPSKDFEKFFAKGKEK